jgi:hypothetical protein
MGDIESIFKVMPYYLARSWRKQHYPMLKTNVLETLYMRTLEEAEDYVFGRGRSYKEFMVEHPEYSKLSLRYSYVVVELPIGLEIHPTLGQNLSTRIYLPDGTIWGENTYADFIPLNCLGEEYNYWGRRNMFGGRKPEEIRFKPGDIVEVMGYPGNHYWGNDNVNLAIVVKTPPTVDEVAVMRKQYLSTHSGFDICDHAMCHEFGNHLDTYEVLSFACDQIDHAPTISVFNTTKQVSAKRRNALQKMYDDYIKGRS